MKKLENLKWSPKWVSHLGCIKGCLDYLGVEVSEAWLYGGTGHAFIINMSDQGDACPSGPTAWKTMKLFELGSNLGYRAEVVFGSKYETGLSKLQQRAWEFVKSAIDGGMPVYAWELEHPEFYVVYAYDDVGYYYSGPGCDEGKGPKPWGELGDTGIGIVEVYTVKPGEVAGAATVIRESLSFALEHARGPEKWILPNYQAGLNGFDAWVRAVERGSAHGLGMAYNAAVWSECRKYAVGFLKEAQTRIGGEVQTLFDQAIQHYQVVADNLEKVSGLYPFAPPFLDTIGTGERNPRAVAALQTARDAEAAGLQALEKIVLAL